MTTEENFEKIKQYEEEYKRRASIWNDIPYDDLTVAEHMGDEMGYMDGVTEFEKVLKDIKSLSDRGWEYGVDKIASELKKKLKYMRDREGNKIGYTKEKTTKPLVMSMPEYRCEGCFAEIKRKDKFCSGCGRRIGWSKNEVN